MFNPWEDLWDRHNLWDLMDLLMRDLKSGQDLQEALQVDLDLGEVPVLIAAPKPIGVENAL